MAISVRTGNTPTPDASWSAFTPIATSGDDIPGSSRYVQYRAALTSGDAGNTPSLGEVSIGYAPAAPDVTPPTISQRTPTPDATGVATNANVSVQFSEAMDPATIDASSLRLRKQGAGSDVAASVSYAGNTATLDPNADLDPNAVYEVTVAGTVEDANGNALGAADSWSFTTAGQALGFTDTTVADFSAGATGAATYVSETDNGEVILKPTEGSEFGGSSLPGGWTSTSWSGGAAATVSGGSLHVNGALAGTDATFGSGRSLEFTATFGAAPFEHVGFSDNFNSVWAIFSTNNTDNQLFARTNTGSAAINTPIPGGLIGSEHRYRIEWDAGEVRFFVDGSLVATHAATFGTAMSPAASEFNAGGPEVSVNWLRMGPYPASGSFDSRVFDAGQGADWGSLSWTAATPGGTGVGLSVRTGNTATPDGTWSAFTPVATSGGDIPGSSRYVQYRAELSTSDSSQTPALSEVTVNGTEDPDDNPVAVDDPPPSPRTPTRTRSTCSPTTPTATAATS